MTDNRIDDDVIVISEEDVVYDSPDDPRDAALHEGTGSGATSQDGHTEDETGDEVADGEPGDGNHAVHADLDAGDQTTSAGPAGTPASPFFSRADAPGAGARETGSTMPGAHAAGAGWPDTGNSAAPEADAVSGEVTETGDEVASDDDQVADADAANVTAPAPSATSHAPAAPAPAGAQGNWPQIQALFVDDPRSAVRQAADVMTGAMTALVAAARNREQALQDTWQPDSTGTEELRTALREYRDLSARISELASQI